jgi:hypothetical protein
VVVCRWICKVCLTRLGWIRAMLTNDWWVCHEPSLFSGRYPEGVKFAVCQCQMIGTHRSILADRDWDTHSPKEHGVGGNWSLQWRTQQIKLVRSWVASWWVSSDQTLMAWGQCSCRGESSLHPSLAFSLDQMSKAIVVQQSALSNTSLVVYSSTTH